MRYPLGPPVAAGHGASGVAPDMNLSGTFAQAVGLVLLVLQLPLLLVLLARLAPGRSGFRGYILMMLSGCSSQPSKKSNGRVP